MKIFQLDLFQDDRISIVKTNVVSLDCINNGPGEINTVVKMTNGDQFLSTMLIEEIVALIEAE